jgi:hypothetical protein
MKKLLLTLLILSGLNSNSQNIYNYGFSGVSADLVTAGWTRTNQSVLPVATRLWSIPVYTAAAATATFQNPFNAAPVAVGVISPVPNGQAGGANSFCLANFQCTSSTAATGATISNWLISPIVNVKNGDIVSFYTRIGKNTTANNASFADNLELRMNTDPAFGPDPSTGSTDLGGYTDLLLAVNPNLDLTSYPSVWTKYSYTVAGIPTLSDVKFAFRYYVTDGGPSGNNSDIIGIDTFSVDRPLLATDTFLTDNFKVYPNPATNVVNVIAKSGTTINQLEITDINGRVVKSTMPKALSSEINISELTSGVYFVKVASDFGSGTTKIVKE